VSNPWNDAVADAATGIRLHLRVNGFGTETFTYDQTCLGTAISAGSLLTVPIRIIEAP
jgi:hypothetical protein